MRRTSLKKDLVNLLLPLLDPPGGVEFLNQADFGIGIIVLDAGLLDLVRARHGFLDNLSRRRLRPGVGMSRSRHRDEQTQWQG